MSISHKKIAILGATGSIGCSTLDVLREQHEHFCIVLASAHNNHEKLFGIAREFKIPYLVLSGDFDESKKSLFKQQCLPSKLYFGEDDLQKLLADIDYDIALNAITGSAGLRSTMTIMGRGKDLALANKESLVMAGHLVKELRSQKGSRILPVDSEHSAIFQALGAHPDKEIRNIHITASGGPFVNLALEELCKVSPENALKHPNWSMGTKVSLDSATMFNKALEVIEAHWLFDVEYERIKAIIHPQSIIHSMVEYIDGSFLAQLSTPDMKLPILYALSYPQRLQSNLVQTSLPKLSQLSFKEIEPRRYPLFYLGVETGKAGGILPTVMNAANEAALQLFLDFKIPFTGIYTLVAETLNSYQNINKPDLETIIAVNTAVYHKIITSR